MKAIYLLHLLLLLFGWSISSVKAVDLIINNSPSTITSDEFEINVSVSGAADGINYLRGDLYKEGTNNYFGETFFDNIWQSTSDGTKYHKVEILHSTASAVLKMRLGSPTSSEYTGTGSYKLKVRRYTSSGNAASNDNQTPKDIQINYSTPSPSPTTTATPRPATPNPTNSPTKVPSAAPVKTSTPRVSNEPTPRQSPEVSNSPEVLALTTEIKDSTTPTISSTPIAKENDKNTFDVFPVIAGSVVLIGVILMGVAGYLVYKAANADKSKL